MAKASITVTLDAQAASDLLATVEQEGHVGGTGGEACDAIEAAVAQAGWLRERFAGTLIPKTAGGAGELKDLRGQAVRDVHCDDAVIISGAEYLRLRYAQNEMDAGT